MPWNWAVYGWVMLCPDESYHGNIVPCVNEAWAEPGTGNAGGLAAGSFARRFVTIHHGL
jgi:hypothetical protein